MTKSIDTLVDDIYALFTDNERTIDSKNIEEFGKRISLHIFQRINDIRHGPVLRVSNLGLPDRKLWYTINTPEAGEKLSPSTRIKFLFGDILEELLLFLAKEAGHDVKGTQDEVDILGVKGHRDAVIDGRVVDVKSASSNSFKKFDSNGLRENDPFGYLDQIGAYLFASQNDPLVTEKDVGSFLVIDKQFGHIALDTYPKTNTDYTKVVEQKQKVLDLPEPPSTLCYEPVPEGKSGNMKLGVQCSYCPFKWECHKNLRAFIYSTGPVYLTKVVKDPKVREVDQNGETIIKF